MRISLRRLLLVGGTLALLWYSRRHAHGWVGNIRTSSVPSAKLYDILAGRALNGLYSRIAQEVADSAHTGSVLDVGCGPGMLAVLLALRNLTVQITGVDISAEMVDLASQRSLEAGVSDRVAFRVGDVTALPFGDAEFDLVVSSLSRHHWPNVQDGIREIHRVLKAGGEARIYDVADWFARIEGGSLALRDIADSGIFDEAELERYWSIGPLPILYRLTLRRAR